MEAGEMEPFLEGVRGFLETRWAEWKDDAKPGWQAQEMPSTDMCRFTAAFLAPALDIETGREWKVCGGFSDFHPGDTGWVRGKGKPQSAWNAGDGVGGMVDAAGVWHDHYWVTDGSVIVDLTADQFGWEAVTVADTADARYLDNWKPKQVGAHLKEVAVRCREWLVMWAEERPTETLHGPSASPRAL